MFTAFTGSNPPSQTTGGEGGGEEGGEEEAPVMSVVERGSLRVCGCDYYHRHRHRATSTAGAAAAAAGGAGSVSFTLRVLGNRGTEVAVAYSSPQQQVSS